MNIAIVTTWFPCGAGNISKAYRDSLERSGHRVFIYARAGKVMRGERDWDDRNVTWAPHHPTVTGIRIPHFMDWMKQHRIDVALFNEQRYWAPVLAAKNAGVLCVCHVDYYKQDWVPAFGIYDVLICNTRRHHSVFQWHPGAYYLPWGTSLEKFAPKTERKSGPLRFMISAGWDGAYAQNAGYMDRRGAGLALEAFSRMKGPCQFLLYSQVALSNCPPRWRQLIEHDTRIVFLMGTFDPFPYAEGDVYVYPSRLDGIGLTLPEALASGLPAITTNAPPMNEFVQHDINGLLVDVATWLGRPDGYYWAESLCSVDALAAAMRTYLDCPGQLEAHREKAVKLARETLDWRKNSGELSRQISEGLRARTVPDPAALEQATQIDRVQSPGPLRVFARLIRDCVGLPPRR